MKISLVKRYVVAALSGPLLLVLSCVLRSGDPHSQSNPFDPGGDNFQHNQGPKYITTSKDSTRWYDFNFNTRKGIIFFTYSAYDPNEKYDTLTYTVYAGDAPGQLDSIYSGRSTVLCFDDIAPSQKVYFRITVKDLYDSSLADSGSFTAPSGLPPMAPAVELYDVSTSYRYIRLRIDTVYGAAGYKIYHSDAINKTYTFLKDTMPSSSSYDYFYFRDYVNDYNFHYYIVSACNSYGESRSDPPVEGRIYYSGIGTPYLSAVSQGTFYDSVKITWTTSSSSSVKYYLLYRKESDAGEYSNIGRINSPGTSTTINHYDTLYTGETCYYAIAAFDSQDRGSRLSSPLGGYFYRISYPSSVSASKGTYSTHIHLTWSSVSGAVSYNIYRDLSATGQYDKIGTTEALSYDDSVVTSDNYYYKISANDNRGREGPKSGSQYGYVKRLPAPSSISASDGTYASHILVTWYSVTGATQYYIYRSTSSSGVYNLIDSTETTNYQDSAISGTSYYYYKVAGVDSAGMVGQLSSYNTGYLRPFSYPSNFQVSNFLYKTHIALTWDKEPKATGYKIYKSTSSSSSSFVLYVTVTGQSFNDSSVVPNTRYYYKISSFNDSTESNLSSYQSGFLLIHPNDFRGLGYSGYINLLWTYNSLVSGYCIYRSVDDSIYEKIATINDYNTSSYRDSVQSYNIFYYKISAFSVKDESALSLPFPCQMVPFPPDSLWAEEHPAHVKLSWKSSEGTKIYYLYRGSSSSSTYLFDSTTVRTYYDTLSSSTKYYYQVAAKNNSGVSPKSHYVRAGLLTTPLAPSSFAVTGNEFCINLAWEQNTTGSLATKFYIYHATIASGTYVIIDSTTDITYHDTVADSATHYYKVSGYNSAGEGSLTSYKSGNRMPPFPPINITVGNELYVTHIPLHWPPSIAAEGYSVYRSTSSSGTYTQRGQTTDTAYSDSTPLPTITYYYKISAYNFIGEGNKSDYVLGKLLSPPLPPTSVSATQGTKKDTITVSWSSSQKTDDYAVYRDTDTNFTAPVMRGITTATLFHDTVGVSTLFVYRIKARNEAGESVLSSAYGIGYSEPTSSPDPPENLKTDSLPTHIGLSWSPPSTGTPVTLYSIYRADSSGGPFQSITTTAELNYDDKVPLSWPTYYWYRITASNKAGEGQPSAIIKGTRK